MSKQDMFSYKPDFEDARRHWAAFWQGEMLDRPCVRVVAPKDGVTFRGYPSGLQHSKDDLVSHMGIVDKWMSGLYYGGDAVPFFFPNFGPDVYAAFLGADLTFAKETGTSWAEPCVADWKSIMPQLRHPHGYWWYAALGFAELARRTGEGKFGVGVWDLHSNLDAMSALRSPQQFCMDLMDVPDDVEAAVNSMRRSYAPIYDGLFEASGMDKTGSSSWLPFYCENKFGIVQCDFICLISPSQARRFLYPALEEEVAFLDHSCYHLDGPGALVHLDDILAIDRIDVIQWVPGDGNPPVIEWMDLLKKMQAAGKSVIVAASVDQVKIYHRELRPDKVFYDVWANSQAEADALVEWLKRNS